MHFRAFYYFCITYLFVYFSHKSITYHLICIYEYLEYLRKKKRAYKWICVSQYLTFLLNVTSHCYNVASLTGDNFTIFFYGGIYRELKIYFHFRERAPCPPSVTYIYSYFCSCTKLHSMRSLRHSKITMLLHKFNLNP